MSELLRKLHAEQVQVLVLVLGLGLVLPHTLHVDRLLELTTVHALHLHVAVVAMVAVGVARVAVVRVGVVGLGLLQTLQRSSEPCINGCE